MMLNQNELEDIKKKNQFILINTIINHQEIRVLYKHTLNMSALNFRK